MKKDIGSFLEDPSKWQNDPRRIGILAYKHSDHHLRQFGA